MNGDLANLVRVARQLLDGELLLGADFLPACQAHSTLPAMAAQTAAPQAAGVSQFARVARPAGGACDKGPPLPALDALPGTPQEKAAALESLKEQAAKCMACQLARTRTNLVFGEGNPAAELVFVGEAPGEDEDLSGRPFVGRAGQKLTEMIRAMGLSREQVYICNVLKCRPPGNRAPAPEEVRVCWPLLIQQLQIIHPKVIVTLGNPATKNLLKTDMGITQIRGHWQQLPAWAEDIEGIDVMPTFHPSYVIRNYTDEVRKMVWSDLKQVMQKLGLTVPSK